MPAPHVCGASGIRSPFLAIFDQSSFSYRPSSQPRPRSPDSTSTTSQFTCFASTIALTLACSPLYSTAVTLLLVDFSNGWLNATFCASPFAPPKLTTVISAAFTTDAVDAHTSAAAAAMEHSANFFMVMVSSVWFYQWTCGWEAKRVAEIQAN